MLARPWRRFAAFACTCGKLRAAFLFFVLPMSSLSPIVFAQHSSEFLDAARRESHASRGTSMPAYFLAARAIELGLKSYLMCRGHVAADLRRISHDLGKALDAARGEGITTAVSIDPETENAVRWINEYYKSKDLEYPTTGYKSYPSISYLIDFAEQLHMATESHRRAWGLALASPSP